MAWQLVASRTVVTRPYITIECNTYKTEASATIDDYYVIRKKPFVLVVANADDDRILMIRQYRPATNRSYLCVPAGYINPGESIEAAAAREALEETGYIVAHAHCIGELHPLPGFIDSPAHVVVCRAVQRERPPADDEAEEVLLLTREEILKRIIAGEINEMQAVSALLLSQLVRPS
jgi:ADP-ribose pyrophosphatase